MKKIAAEFQLAVGEFRMASYYGLFLRHRSALRILFAVLLVAVVYAIGACAGLGEANPLVFFLAGAYLIWGLLLFAGAEKDIRSYLRRPDSLISCSYRVFVEDRRLRVEIPERKLRESCNLHSLACCFELSALFLFYTTPQNVYLLPKRALTEEETQALRAELAACLKGRFSSRFLKKARG